MFRKPFPCSTPNEPERVGLSYLDESGVMAGQNLFAAPDHILDETSILVSHTGVQHIGFKVASEEFLLPMEPVREIIMLPKITFVPRSDPAIEGVIALRGEIMPVLNIRRLLNFPRGEPGPTTRVIILQSQQGGFGAIVDDITEFVWLQTSDLESSPQAYFGSDYKVLSGVAKVGENIRAILDVTKLIQNLNHEGDRAS